MAIKQGIIANRPIRCNNPGSLDYHEQFKSWLPDLADPPHDFVTRDGQRVPGRVAVFKTPMHGVKRLAIQIIHYLHPVTVEGGHGLDTPRKFVSVYAPNDDPLAHNDEKNYSGFLASRLHVGLDEKLTIEKHLDGLVRTVANMETGHELEDIWDDECFVEEGIRLAKLRFGMA